MKIVITGGGTGGHIFPALAVARALKEAGHTLIYIGKNPTAENKSMESQLVPEAGFDFAGIDFFGMPRQPGLKLIQWLFALAKAKKQAGGLIQDFAPDVIFGTGGYVSAPVLLADRKSVG